MISEMEKDEASVRKTILVQKITIIASEGRIGLFIPNIPTVYTKLKKPSFQMLMQSQIYMILQKMCDSVGQ